MSPKRLLFKPSFTVAPLEKSPQQKFAGGAVITGLDLNNISGKSLLLCGACRNALANHQSEDEDVKWLSDAIWIHKVIIVKGQKDLAPIKQWELVTRFDPEAPRVHSHGDTKTFSAKGGVLSVCT